MSNKENLKRTMEKDFNKEKIYNKIVKKIERGIIMNKTLKYSLVPLCIIAIVCGIIIFNNNNFQLKEKPTIELEKLENDNEISVNNFDHAIKGFQRLDVDIKLVIISELSSKFNFVSSIVIPNDLKQKDMYALYVSNTEKEIKDRKYDILHDYVIYYENKDKQRNIKIAFSEISNPIRDYLMGDIEKTSKINNIDVEISKYKDLYLVTFSYSNLFFDVETSGITIDELVDLLESVLR